MGLFDNFSSLDGLIQVVYHSTSCFVLISNVETASWVIELGLVGRGGRWWRGSWSEKDVLKFAGTKVSEKVLESFSTRLANFIIAGELSIGDWNASQGAEIELQINPTGNAPVEIDMVELSAEEGSSRAVTILKGMALQAQSRGCRINGSEAEAAPPCIPTSKPRTSEPLTSKQDEELRLAQDRIKHLESEVNQAKQAAVETSIPSPSKSRALKAPPGASRANPTRQKRKIVEAEFESD